MTIIALAMAWLALTALVSARGTRLLGRFRPGLQAGVFFGATVGLTTIPASALLVLLSQRLYVSEVSGSFLSRCGRLIQAILLDPLARPEVTLALLLLVAGTVGIALGVVGALRSQRGVRALVKGPETRLVVIPSGELVAFTTGFLRPRVVASSALMMSAREDWRRVVLAHEEAHRRGRHPLLLLVVESLARGLPLRPLRLGANATRLALEMVADDHALREVGNRELVAEAVAGIALTPATAGVGFEGDAVRRVRRLMETPLPGRVSLGLVLAAGVVGVLAFTAGHGMHCGDLAFRTLRTEGCPVHLTVDSSTP